MFEFAESRSLYCAEASTGTNTIAIASCFQSLMAFSLTHCHNGTQRVIILADSIT